MCTVSNAASCSVMMLFLRNNVVLLFYLKLKAIYSPKNLEV